MSPDHGPKKKRVWVQDGTSYWTGNKSGHFETEEVEDEGSKAKGGEGPDFTDAPPPEGAYGDKATEKVRPQTNRGGTQASHIGDALDEKD